MTSTPSDKEQAFHRYPVVVHLGDVEHHIEMDRGGELARSVLVQLDTSTRSRVLREAIPESDWARISDEDDEAAQRFLEMSDEELDAAIVAAGGDTERHRRASQAIGRWARKLAEMHGELTTTRAEVERLKVELADAKSAFTQRVISDAALCGRCIALFDAGRAGDARLLLRHAFYEPAMRAPGLSEQIADVEKAADALLRST